MNKYLEKIEIDYFFTCLAEECGEVMELLYLKPNDIEKIEFELNDLFGVLDLLNDKKILNVHFDIFNLDNKKSIFKDIFKSISTIQYLSHKVIRFGLTNSKNNKIELEKSIFLLINLIRNNNKLFIWDNFDIKKDKILEYFTISKSNY